MSRLNKPNLLILIILTVAMLLSLERVQASPQSDDVVMRWHDVQTRAKVDLDVIAKCRANSVACPHAAQTFIWMADNGKAYHGRARIDWVNRVVNSSIRGVSDEYLYGVIDYWASPLETLKAGAGDCEDYVILKYALLKQLGIASDSIRFVVVRDIKHGAFHAVLWVKLEGQWLVLDNLNMEVVRAEEARSYIPLVWVN